MRWPVFAEDEIAAVSDVLRSGRVNYWTGEHGVAFESEFANYCGARYGVALANGTVALEVILKALGVRTGDDVVVTPRSFIASASSIVSCGARPVFADVDRDSQNVTVDTLEAAITPKARAVIAVHLAGWPCEMRGIAEFCKRHDLFLIEDCAQAHGASIDGQRVGTFSDAAAFSFCQDKIMTTCGEGGMVVTDSESVRDYVWSYKDHGKNSRQLERARDQVGFRWLHDTIGTNGRMTEVQAIVGRLQLAKLDEWLEIRRKNAARLAMLLRDVPALRIPQPANNIRHAWYKFYAFLLPERLRGGWNRDRVLQEVTAQDVACYSGSCPEIYLEKAFEGSDWVPGRRLDTARELGETSLMLLVDPCQSADRIETSAQVLADVLAKASR